MLRKYTIILALSVCGIVSAFAQGAVIGYAAGGDWIKPGGYTYTTFPANAQLQRLTHVIASDIGVITNKSTKSYTGLWIKKLPNDWNTTQSGDVWNKSSKNNWLLNLVSRAHAEGVKVILCVGGGDPESYDHWVNATSGDQANSSSSISKFVSDIVKFANDHGLDGVDIDWERINNNSTHWGQCFNLLTTLKSHQDFQCKRISVALPYKHPDTYPAISGSRISGQIWNTVDAIHLMTYDESQDGSDFVTHSQASSANKHINNWAQWNVDYSLGMDLKKLHVGCAFYGWHPNIDDARVGYKDYATKPCSNKGDNLTDVATKVNHCYGDNSNSRVFGGVFIWELGYDKIVNNVPELLDAICTKNNEKGGHVPTPLCTDRKSVV